MSSHPQAKDSDVLHLISSDDFTYTVDRVSRIFSYKMSMNKAAMALVRAGTTGTYALTEV